MNYMVSYITCKKWHDYNLHQRPEHQGFGGGMAVKTQRIYEALNQQYYTQLTDNPEEVSAPVVLVEPLWFKLFNQDENEHWEKITQIGKLDAQTLILVCSEFEVMRWEAKFRDAVLNTFDKITCNCQYQANIFSYYDITPDAILCDPIPMDVFMPPADLVKENSIVATGHVSWFKNVKAVIKAFKGFQEKGISTGYIGSAGLWGKPKSKNDPALQLETELRRVTDVFYPSLTQAEVARTMQKYRFGLWLATHECFGQGYAEMMATGLPVVAGEHGLKAERHSNDVSDDIDAMIEDAEEYAAVSTWNRQWAITQVSYQAFLKQFTGVLRK